jgi:hypothetical protein
MVANLCMIKMLYLSHFNFFFYFCCLGRTYDSEAVRSITQEWVSRNMSARFSFISF